MYPDSDTPQQAPSGGGFLSGAKRSIAMGALAAALLVVGGSAVALAADPSASPDPSATAQPADGGTTAPSTTAPGTGRPAHGDCPAKDGSGTGTTPNGATTTPSPDVTTPAPSVDTSDV